MKNFNDKHHAREYWIAGDYWPTEKPEDYDMIHVREVIPGTVTISEAEYNEFMAWKHNTRIADKLEQRVTDLSHLIEFNDEQD